MTPTSEERREVAARLRTTKAECDERGYPWMVEDLMQALGFETYEDGEDGIFDYLAYLIDPTCTMRDATWDDGTCKWGCICSACGAKLEYEYAQDLAYCPDCGARVVNSDDQ